MIKPVGLTIIFCNPIGKHNPYGIDKFNIIIIIKQSENPKCRLPFFIQIQSKKAMPLTLDRDSNERKTNIIHRHQ